MPFSVFFFFFFPLQEKAFQRRAKEGRSRKDGKEGKWAGNDERRTKTKLKERYEENAERLIGRNIASLPETRRYRVRLETGNGGTSVMMSLAQAASAGVPWKAIGKDAETDERKTERILSGLLRKSDAYLTVRQEGNGRWLSYDVLGTRTEAVTSGGTGPVILMDGSASGKVISCRCGKDELLVIALNRSEKAAVGKSVAENDGESVIAFAMDRRRLLSQEMAKVDEDDEKSKGKRNRY